MYVGRYGCVAVASRSAEINGTSRSPRGFFFHGRHDHKVVAAYRRRADEVAAVRAMVVVAMLRRWNEGTM